jgi:hypothetical protein
MSNDNNDEFDLFDLPLEEYLSDPLAELLESKLSESYKDDTIAYDVLLNQYVYQLKLLANKITPSDGYLISGSGPAWYYHPTTRDFIKCERGIEVHPVSTNVKPNKEGNIMVRTASTYLLIPFDELIKVGFN